MNGKPEDYLLALMIKIDTITDVWIRNAENHCSEDVKKAYLNCKTDLIDVVKSLRLGE